MALSYAFTLSISFTIHLLIRLPASREAHLGIFLVFHASENKEIEQCKMRIFYSFFKSWHEMRMKSVQEEQVIILS